MNAASRQWSGGQSYSGNGCETYQHNCNFRYTSTQAVFSERGMQQDDCSKVDKLRDNEGLHPERAVGDPSEPFAKAGSGEPNHEEDNREPSRESCCGTRALRIESQGGKRGDNDGAIREGGEGKELAAE